MFGVLVNNRCPFCKDHGCAQADCSSLYDLEFFSIKRANKTSSFRCPCTGSKKEKTCKCPYKVMEDMPATAPEGGCCAGGAGDKSGEVAT